MIVEFSIYVREKIGAREGRTLDECRDPWINPRRPIVRRGRGRGRDSETVTCRLNVTQDSRLFHSLPEERSFSLSLSFSRLFLPRGTTRGKKWFAMSFARFRLVSLSREREKNLKREREREECPNLFSPLVERARRPMSLGGAEGSPTLN